MVTIQSFVKKYATETILTIESLHLMPGIYFVRGQNGSGKTTFFKCLAGIVPCSGEITIDGATLTNDPIAYRMRVNFAEAEPKFPDFLTARDLLDFVGKCKHADQKQIDYYADRLGVANFAHKPCGTYSSGMMKKLSLALAFLGHPRMILLDEPLTTLDANTRKELFNLFSEKRDVTLMLSSHHVPEGEQLTIAGTFIIKDKQLVTGALY